MSNSGTQHGVLRKKDLDHMPAIPDHSAAEIEYVDSGTVLPNGRVGVDVVNVKKTDGQVIEDSDYIFIVKGDGYFIKELHLILNKQDNKWRVIG
jgi:hypothetical protein